MMFIIIFIYITYCYVCVLHIMYHIYEVIIMGHFLIGLYCIYLQIFVKLNEIMH